MSEDITRCGGRTLSPTESDNAPSERRCDGRIFTIANPPNSGLGVHSQCLHCVRRTDEGAGDHVVYMGPPEFVGGECPMRIAPGIGPMTGKPSETR